MVDGGLKQPYVFLEEDADPVLLAPKYTDVELSAESDPRSLAIALREDTDLKTVLKSYTDKMAPSAANLLDTEEHELRYEFYQMPLQASGKEYYTVTKDGVVTPKDLKGNAYKPVAEGKAGIVQVRLFMKDHLVAIAYLKFFITKVDPVEGDDFFKYWVESYNGQGSAGSDYKPVFVTELLVGQTDEFTTQAAWANVNYLDKWELTLDEFHNDLHYAFMGFAPTAVAPKPADLEDGEVYLEDPITRGITASYDSTEGTITLTRTPDSKCLMPGTYVFPVYFKQSPAGPTKKAYPQHIVVYMKVKVVDSSKAAVDAVVAKLNDYKLAALWDNNLVHAKGLPTTIFNGYEVVIKTTKVFNTLTKFQKEVEKAAKANYGTDIEFYTKIVSVEGGDENKDFYSIIPDGDEFAVKRLEDKPLKETERVTVSYGFSSTVCPDATRELFQFTISFEHAAKYEVDPHFLVDEAAIRVKDGVIEIRDNLAEHSFQMLEVIKLFSNEATPKLLLENGMRRIDETILGSKKIKVNVTLPADNSFVQRGILTSTPASLIAPHHGLGQRISWKNLTVDGHASIIHPVEITTKLEINYGSSYKYEKPLIIRIIPDTQW